MAIGSAAGLVGFGAVWLSRGGAQAARAADAPGGTDVRQAAILMRDGMVIDLTPDCAAILPVEPFAGQDWTGLRTALAPLFPGLPLEQPGQTTELTGTEGATLRIEALTDAPRAAGDDVVGAGLLRLTIAGGADTPTRSAPTGPEREVLDLAPDPVWQTSATGALRWHNSAYGRLCAEMDQQGAEALPFADIASPEIGDGATRARVRLSDGAERWYAVTHRAAVDGFVHFATPIDALVEAEMAQRTFVQTLTKTFAHLPIGLAVFDRDHRLVLFNPALVDLTRLPVDFLTARPNLLSFFDHMRENRMMPEPKNYNSWREQLADVICAARDDRYCETWNIASGLTYKITGRPHPDRAVAFLIEDISAEISLTRRFRSELELTQSVIDCFDDAVVVFSQLGVLTFCNAAYREMWKCDPDSTFAEVSISEATRDWQRACAPSPIWSDMRDFVLTLRERATWDADVELLGGGRLTCTIEPVAAGATMIRFTRESTRQMATA